MRTIRTITAAVALVLAASAGAAEQAAKTEKPLVSCSQIVETYRLNKSVDETSSALVVHQSVVAACLKAAGINPPQENNR